MDWLFSLFPFDSEVLENYSEMSKMKHQVISEHKVGCLSLEKEMWADFNYDT